MRVDLHPIFNVNIVLCEFFNVHLDERGYYQVRLVPKHTNEFLSVEIVCNNSSDNENVSSTNPPPKRESLAELLPATVLPGNVAVSRTVEVTYVDEKFALDDVFNISVQLNATTDFTTVSQMTIDLELWFMDRYRPPRLDAFEFQSRRTVQVLLDPSRVYSVARPIFFDCTDVAALSLCVHTAMVSMLPRRRKPPPDSPLSTKLRTYHKSSCLALLSTTHSIEKFIETNAKFLTTVVHIDVTDVEQEMKELEARLEAAERPWAVLEAECVTLSSKLTTTFSHMLQLFQRTKQLYLALLHDYDKWRRSILGEAFFYIEKSMHEVLSNAHSNHNDIYSIVTKGKYLLRLPKFPIFCQATDSPGETCPVIFEECFAASRDPELSSPTSTLDDNAISPLSKLRNTASVKETSTSFRQRIRNEATKSLRLIKKRRKSADCTHSMAVRRKQLRPRTSTLGFDALVKTDNDGMTSPVEGMPKAESLNAISSTTRTEIEDAMQKMDIHDNGDDGAGSDTLSSPTLTALAASTSNSSTTYTSPLPLQESNAEDMRVAVEFVREREAMKSRLRMQAGFEAFLYSERALTQSITLPCCPLAPNSHSRRANVSTHLVVFVHGLDGSYDDLSAYRCALRQSFLAHEFCADVERRRQKHKDGEQEAQTEKWELECLMSRTNQRETWADITSLAHNLLNEISEFVEEHETPVKRISFVAHSLGGVIVRSAVGLAASSGMTWLWPTLHTLMTINTPHLGLTYVGKHVHWGVQLVQWWKRSRSIDQLALRDAINFTDSFLFSLSANQALGRFRHILLIGTPTDLLVPVHSALLEPSKTSSKDPSALGAAYREMLNNILSDVCNSSKTETLIRYITFHKNSTANSNRFMGRAAHIAAVEDETFIEKLFAISALRYFV